MLTVHCVQDPAQADRGDRQPVTCAGFVREIHFSEQGEGGSGRCGGEQDVQLGPDHSYRATSAEDRCTDQDACPTGQNSGEATSSQVSGQVAEEDEREFTIAHESEKGPASATRLDCCPAHVQEHTAAD